MKQVMLQKNKCRLVLRAYLTVLACAWCFFTSVLVADAATLSLNPGTGVYTVGGTFTARVVINTEGKPVNAAEGTLSFNTNTLTVLGVSRTSSIFNLWTQEPTFSNSAGTISFGGGSPGGYSGSAGTVLTITFQSKNAGAAKVSFTDGSVLAADGRGTNVLTSMSGGTYTISAPTLTPEAETVYVPPANTPAAPVVRSSTHTDPDGWYPETTAELSWTLPSGVTAVRTLLDEYSSTIPTVVYDDPIAARTVSDLPEGVSYFHIQFKNADGWGKVTHYRLAVDTEAPTAFVISESEDRDPAHPTRTLQFAVTDATSPVTRYLVQIDGGDGIEFIDEEETGEYTLPELSPGHHTVIVEAFDAAGNSRVATYAFDIAAFDRPVFTEYPTKINNEVIPVLRGSTRPDATVEVMVTGTNGYKATYTITSDAAGQFTFIPDNSFEFGVYDIVAVATDAHGAQSEPSEIIRIAVERPGYVRIGSLAVSVLSIVVPLIALLLILCVGVWYLWNRFTTWRRRIRKETAEAEAQLTYEFDDILKKLDVHVTELKGKRKQKLTKAELALIEQIEDDLKGARARIQKEITDIEDVTGS